MNGIFLLLGGIVIGIVLTLVSFAILAIAFDAAEKQATGKDPFTRKR